MLDTICLEMSNVDTSIEDILLTYKRGVNADEVFAAIYPRVKDSAEKFITLMQGMLCHTMSLQHICLKFCLIV